MTSFIRQELGCVPKWWFDAFRSSTVYENTDPGVQHRRAAPALVPSFSHEELWALLKLLMTLQSKILTTKISHEVTLTLKDICTSFPGTSDPELMTIEKMGWSLPAIHTISHDRLTPLFELSNDSYEPGQITYKLLPHTLELLFGCTDVYARLLRSLEGSSEKELSTHPHTPFPLPLSLWPEMEGHERMAATQLFATQFWRHQYDETKGLYYSRPIDILGWTGEEEKWSTRHRPYFESLGKKLLNKGLIRPIGDQPFWGEDPQNISRNIYWSPTLSQESFLKSGPWDGLSKILFSNITEESLFKLCAHFFGSGLDFDTRCTIQNIWPILKEVVLEESATPLDRCVIDSRFGLIHSPLLFLEWSLRSSPMHPAALPLSFHKSLFSELCRLTDSGIKERFQKFCSIVGRDPFVKKFIVGQEGVCMGLHQVTQVQAVNVEQPSQEETTPADPPKLENVPVKKETPVVERPQNVEEKRETAESTQPEQPTPHRIQDRKVALRELQRIRKFDKPQYQELTSSYIRTLSSQQQSILTDLKGRMRKDIFEEQMNQKLVAYMMENQGSWRSVALPQGHLRNPST